MHFVGQPLPQNNSPPSRSGQQHGITFNNFLLHMPIHVLKSYSEVFFIHNVIVFFETSVLKEVCIISPLIPQ